MSARRGERYTDGEIATIRRMAGERMTDDEIALLLGREGHSILYVRRRLGIAAGGGTYERAAPVEADLVERIRDRAREGWSDERIGRSVGRSWTQVATLRRRFGIGAGNPKLRQNAHIAGPQIAADARRDAHIQMLRERKEARRAAEMQGVEA